MGTKAFSATNSRREFLKSMFSACCMLGIYPGEQLAETSPGEKHEESTDFIYKYRTMSIDYFVELQEFMDTLDRGGKLSDNEIYRRYIDTKKFVIPDDFTEAKSIVILATFNRPMLVDFHMDGKTFEVMVPPQYYDDGISKEQLKNTVGNKIIQKQGHRVERVRNMFLKPLAVRSGLARYGRNNITYVKGMGSFLALSAFLTDYEFEKDQWNELRMMDSCHECRICMHRCPNKCITEKNFVIDAGRCLSLYNEIEGEFPEWIEPTAHNALIGCMRCQLQCPGNREVIELSGRLESVTEEETEKILKGEPDDILLKSLTSKLRSFYPAQSKENFPIFTRNLKALLHSPIP